MPNAPVAERAGAAAQESRHSVGSEPDGICAHHPEGLRDRIGEHLWCAVRKAEPHGLLWRHHITNHERPADDFRDDADLLGDRKGLGPGQDILAPAMTLSRAASTRRRRQCPQDRSERVVPGRRDRARHPPSRMVGTHSSALLMNPPGRRNVAGMPDARTICSRSWCHRPIAGIGSPSTLNDDRCTM